MIIDCTVGGFANTLVLRRNAKPGDLVGVSGTFGLQSSGLKMLLNGAKSETGFKRKAVNSVLNPRANLELGIALSKYLTSCIDSSDGLALSIYHLAESSRVNMELERLPISHGVRKFAILNSLNEEELVLFGGEEYELVFTFNKMHATELSQMGVMAIGRVLSNSKKGEEPSVIYKSKVLPRRGWVHNA